MRLPECLVEPPAERIFCFNLPTPSREYFINADNAEEMFDWIQILRSTKTYLGTPSKYGFTAKASDMAPTRIEQLAQEIPARIPVHKWKINGKLCSNCLHGSQVITSPFVTLFFSFFFSPLFFLSFLFLSPPLSFSPSGFSFSVLCTDFFPPHSW
jgi:hypothetical protein